MSFRDALAALNDLKADGLVDDYAIAGAMALVFWTEPVPTYDLDVLIAMPQPPGGLVSLESIYRWAQARNFPAKDEHILVGEIPVQLVPAPNALADEAIKDAADLDYEGLAVRVVRPEYLVALYLEPHARTAKRRERAVMLLESPQLNRARLDAILDRHGLSV